MEQPKPYKQTIEYAMQNGEIELFQEDLLVNRDCIKAIDKAIRDCNFEQYRYKMSDAVKAAVEQFGFERVTWVLAGAILGHEYDGRYSQINKEWARNFDIPRDERSGFIFDTHPAVLDGFVDSARKAYREILADTVGQYEKSHRMAERNRLTWYHNDLGSFVPNPGVTERKLLARYNKIMEKKAEKQSVLNSNKNKYKEAESMPSYTLDELLKIMGPQARRDKILINECIDGLGMYAALKARDNSNSKEIGETRALVENLVYYWGLNDGETAKPVEEFLQSFDSLVDGAKFGAEIVGDDYKSCANILNGLYRHGQDLIVGQGDSAMGEILAASDLMKEVVQYFGYETKTLYEMTAHLESEVRSMLNSITLPGHPESGENVHGYEVKQAISFDNDRGFALAKNPGAPSPFVTWQFTNEGGNRNHYWGHYFGTEEKALIDYIYRVANYMERNKVTEKAIPSVTAEVNSEQNYNMIDGVRNNEDFPSPDLTDGQTYEEIRELAPEMLPDETVDDTQQRIPVQILTESQPLVTVTFSEHEQLRGVEKMPLYLANTMFFEADERQSSDYVKSGRTIPPYLKTEFRIEYMRDGKPEVYSGQYDIGTGDETLTEHIEDYAEYYKEYPGNQESFEYRGGEKITGDAQFDIILNELVPFFDKHCELSKREADALSELMEIHEAAAGNPSNSAKVRIEYLEAVVENTRRSRAALNGMALDGLTEPPKPVEESAKDITVCDNTSVLGKIKASQKAPKKPHKPKRERGKKSNETEH